MLWLRSAFSEQRYDIHHVIAEGDTVAVHLTHSGRHTGEFLGIPATNRRFAYEHVHIVRFKDGKAFEQWAVRDDATLMRQLTGELTAPEPAASPA
jgi:predicted ester cyclase